jgi:hypothetical protein
MTDEQQPQESTDASEQQHGGTDASEQQHGDGDNVQGGTHVDRVEGDVHVQPEGDQRHIAHDVK